MNPLSRALRWAASALLVAGLSGCNLLSAAADVLLNSYSLTVVNNCLGPDTTVNFYLDEQFQGTVYASRVFYPLPTGTYALRARGTGSGGTTFRRTLYLDSDTRWTLCP